MIQYFLSLAPYKSAASNQPGPPLKFCFFAALVELTY